MLTGFTLTRPRVLTVAAILALVLIGSLLPYLSMPYITFSVEPAVMNGSLFPAADFVRGIEPRWLPNFTPGPVSDRIDLALQVLNLGPSLQQAGVVIGVLSCVALFQDEINKFLWWPLHLSGWLLAVSVVPLFVGIYLLRQADVVISLKVGWVPLVLAGVLILVATFRARSRIDTYGSI
jgi:hypothetical protein